MVMALSQQTVQGCSPPVRWRQRVHTPAWRLEALRHVGAPHLSYLTTSSAVCFRNPLLHSLILTINRSRRDGMLSWPCWLTNSGQFSHKAPSCEMPNAGDGRFADRDQCSQLLYCQKTGSKLSRSEGYKVGVWASINSMKLTLNFSVV